MGKIVNDLIEQKLFELMESRSFEKLTIDEKEFVKNNFSEKEYLAQSQIMDELEELEQEAYNHQNPRDSLNPPMIKKGFKIKKMLTLKVPSYAVAASIVLAISIPFMFKNDRISEPESFTNIENTRNGAYPSDSINFESKEELVQEEIGIALFADSINTIKLKQVIETTLAKPKGRSTIDDPFDVFYSAL